MLKRARNAGLIDHNGEIVGPAVWEPIIPQEQWRALVALLRDPSRPNGWQHGASYFRPDSVRLEWK